MRTSLTGLSIANTHNPIETYHQLGGPGRVFNKALAIPMHLGQPWHSVEFVRIPPGHNGVGAHQQATDEIYLILSGRGELVTNGEPALVETGTLAGAPVGTVHALTNASATEDLTLLVVELAAPGHAPAYPPSWCHLLQELQASSAFHPVIHGQQRVRPRLATVDLRRALAASWGSLSLVEVPPGCRIPPYAEPEDDQLLLVMHGHATFTIPREAPEGGTPAEPIRVYSDNRSHQSVLVPRGVPCGWTNRASGEYPLLVACLTVRPARRLPETEVAP
jgi:quercetin dioxygenase-like cupin family protein